MMIRAQKVYFMTDKTAPPNGWTRLCRRVLMVGSTLIVLGWFIAWITGWSDREPTVTSLLFLGGMALTATSGGDNLMRKVVSALGTKGGSDE